MMRMTLSVLALAAAGCSATVQNASEVDVRPQLAGTWVLNAAESSDSTRTSARTLNEPPPEPVVADRRRGWNDGDTVRVRRALSERAARALQAVRTPVQRITISDSAGAFVLRGEVGDGVRVTPDGTTARVAWLDGTPADVRTRWVAQRLEVVRRLDGGTMIREFYSRSPGSSRLIVFTIVTGPFDGEITLRRVYEASS